MDREGKIQKSLEAINAECLTRLPLHKWKEILKEDDYYGAEEEPSEEKQMRESPIEAAENMSADEMMEKLSYTAGFRGWNNPDRFIREIEILLDVVVKLREQRDHFARQNLEWANRCEELTAALKEARGEK